MGVTTASTEQLLGAVERGIEESGLAQPSSDVQASVNGLLSAWSKLPPDLRTLVIGLIVVVLGLVIEYTVFVKNQAPLQVTVNQKVKVVQQITNKIFVRVGVSGEERRQFRVVSKDNLLVFRSNRRDSGRLGSLSAGQIVIVRSKKRNWTQVEWTDANSEVTQTGWVLSRFLKKI